MVYCFAYGSNTNSISAKKATFKFPKESHIRKKWVNACNRKKEDILKAKKPRLCEDRFNEDSYQRLPSFVKQIRGPLKLKPTAVPDKKRFHKHNIQAVRVHVRSSLAYQKWNNIDVSLTWP